MRFYFHSGDEEIFSYISSNFCFGTSMKTGIDSNTLASNQDDLVCFPGFVSDDLVMEILSILPVKSLMRFKSVCKHWSSLIKHDRRFADLHHINNCLKSRPNILCITGINPRQQQVYAPQQEDGDKQHVDYEEEQQEEDRIDGYKFPQQILCADIVEETIMNKVIMTDDKWFDYEYVLGLVNGLACFLDWDEDDVRIYNVSTREASPWIKSTLLSEEKGKFDTSIRRQAIYRFGFDPEKKEHKIFCFCRLSDRTKPSRIAECPDYTSCEVLAVGSDTKWRRINVVPNENNKIKINKVFPSFDVQRDSVYGNGTIYWRNLEPQEGSRCWK
ncbi:hypothetical protein MKX03_012079 [Papaver bracteatum]|nr:hypothetical protein MKX03_012079 [Papaver bracteatum]